MKRVTMQRLKKNLSVRVKRTTRCGLLLSLFAFAASSLCFAPMSSAEAPSAGSALFNGRAQRKADDVKALGRSPKAVRPGFDLPQSSAAVSDLALSSFSLPESSQTVLTDSASTSASVARSDAARSLLFRPELTDHSDALEWESKTAAEQLFFFESYSLASKVVVRSDLRPFYLSALRIARRMRDYTSLKVGQRADGALSVVNSSETSPLLEFRVRATPSSGVEPRVEIGDHFVLRHNFIEHNSLFEFRTEF